MRIAGVEINDKKRVIIGLTYIYGIGDSIAQNIVDQFHISESTKIGELDQKTISAIEDYIDKNITITDELKRKLAMQYKKLISLKCYRGIRRMKGLPCRGNRTRSNGKTAKKLLKSANK